MNLLFPATLGAVALGGATGAVLRWLTGLAFARALGVGFPWATFAVNIAGGFAMGLFVAVLGARGMLASPLGLLLTTGLLGGFTTFSAFSLETVAMLDRGAGATAAVYALASVTLSVAAVMIGRSLARAALGG